MLFYATAAGLVFGRPGPARSIWTLPAGAGSLAATCSRFAKSSRSTSLFPSSKTLWTRPSLSIGTSLLSRRQPSGMR